MGLTDEARGRHRRILVELVSEQGPRSIPSRTRRCWAPSCGSRSMRRALVDLRPLSTRRTALSLQLLDPRVLGRRTEEERAGREPRRAGRRGPRRSRSAAEQRGGRRPASEASATFQGPCTSRCPPRSRARRGAAPTRVGRAGKGPRAAADQVGSNGNAENLTTPTGSISTRYADAFRLPTSRNGLKKACLKESPFRPPASAARRRRGRSYVRSPACAPGRTTASPRAARSVPARISTPTSVTSSPAPVQSPVTTTIEADDPEDEVKEKLSVLAKCACCQSSHPPHW